MHLYGKDGQKGGIELPVTAQVTLVFTINCKSVSVPVLVQPNSEQAYLLGLDTISLFEIKLVDSGGESIFPETTNTSVNNKNRDENVMQ